MNSVFRVTIVCIVALCHACNHCSSWMSWDTCSHRCGGGVQRRICIRGCNSTGSTKMISQNRQCNKICNNGGTFDVNGCLCLVGFRGRCCQLDCEDGYYGDNCNRTCACPATSKCDKVTGDCLVVGVGANKSWFLSMSSSHRLYIIIGVAVGAFVIVQVLVAIVVSKYLRGRKEEKSSNRLENGKFWMQKANSNPVLDTPENHYEEIPFDTNGRLKSVNGKEKGNGSVKKASFKKGSVKKGSIRKGSVKSITSNTPKKEEMYQFLEHPDEDCGYQRLVEHATINTPICNPKYMAMTGSTGVDIDRSTETEAGYLEMNNQLHV